MSTTTDQRPRVTPPTLSIMDLRKSYGFTLPGLSAQLSVEFGQDIDADALREIETGKQAPTAQVVQALESLFNLPSGSLTPAPAEDICPRWCSGDHTVFRGGKTHPEDAGVNHRSTVLDTWVPVADVGTGANEDPISVTIECYRHDEGDDWPAEIEATNTHPGFLSGLGLPAADAHRLGLALLTASATVTHDWTPEQTNAYAKAIRETATAIEGGL